MKLRSRLRYEARKFAYSPLLGPVLWRLIGARRAPTRVGQSNSDSDRWDHDLSNEFASYLDSTLTVVARARLIGTLAHHLRPQSASALDIGCGAGQLAEALFERGFERYLGVDISRVAIEAARQKLNASRDRFPAVCHFETGEIGKYVPSRTNSEHRFDLIVLSEVLYYLPTPDDAVAALRQFATWLNGDGLIMISLKDDGKSHAIVRQVAKQFAVLSSFLFQDQETPTSGSFRIQVSRERPAYLISALTLKTSL